jgi:hypothetical protein
VAKVNANASERACRALFFVLVEGEAAYHEAALPVFLFLLEDHIHEKQEETVEKTLVLYLCQGQREVVAWHPFLPVPYEYDLLSFLFLVSSHFPLLLSSSSPLAISSSVLPSSSFLLLSSSTVQVSPSPFLPSP